MWCRRIIAVAVWGALGLLAPGCGTSEYAVIGTSRSPGTDGVAQVEEIEGGQHLVTMAIDNLPPPERVAEGMRTYHVWFVDTEGAPTHVGVLEYNKATREGRLMGTTDHSRFTIRVTAESTDSPTRPSDVLVATRNIDAD